jgi:hypothetical protein
MIAEVDFGKNALNHLKFPMTLQNGEVKTKPTHWGTDQTRTSKHLGNA